MAPRRPLLLPTIGFVLGTCATVAALPAGSPAAHEAIALCQQAEEPRADAERVEILTRGYHLAEAAVRADARDGLAHFALFCNLARRIRMSGLRFALPLDMLRALRALDRAIELAPADPDVLTAKGALLIELPRLLGGDAGRGEEWLRRALAVDPQHDVARTYLNSTRVFDSGRE
jgi:hypothetical protein